MKQILFNVMTDYTKNLCSNIDQPDCFGQECACVSCVMWEEWGFCVEYPCEFCEGPVDIRCYPEEIAKQLAAICGAEITSHYGEDDEFTALDTPCQETGS